MFLVSARKHTNLHPPIFNCIFFSRTASECDRHDKKIIFNIVTLNVKSSKTANKVKKTKKQVHVFYCGT